jgi:hypothetical protein
MISGGVDNMEKYKYMLGRPHALPIYFTEISNLLNKKEQKDEQGTVIDLGKRNPKNKNALEEKINNRITRKKIRSRQHSIYVGSITKSIWL